MTPWWIQQPVMGDPKEAVMADEPKPEPKPDPKATKTEEDVQRLQKALDDERKARREADASVKDLSGKIAKLEGEGKSKDEQLTEQLTKLQKDLDGERVMRLKAEVAASKGLSPAQAKRLTGATKEDLEADADDLLEAFPAPSSEDTGGSSRGRPPSQRPKADLRGGTEPDTDPVETDPAKLAESVPRL